MESTTSYRCVEFADRLDWLLAAVARDDAVERPGDLMFRFVALDATVPSEWIDSE